MNDDGLKVHGGTSTEASATDLDEDFKPVLVVIVLLFSGDAANT